MLAVAFYYKLKRFKDLIVSDTTVMKLHDFLEKEFPSCYKGKGLCKVKSTAKVHYKTGINASAPHPVSITPEKVSDISGLKIDKWVKDKLLLFDMGFYGYKIFYKISKNEGFFITRLKEPNKLTIVAGENKDYEDSPVGMTVNEALYWLRREVFDVEVELGINMKTKTRGQISRKRRFRILKSGKVPEHIKIFRLRVVCIWNPVERRYHRYITNIFDSKALNAKDIAEVYGYRWEVEMIFKELKSYYHIDEFSTRKKCIVEALIYSALISMVVCRMLMYGLCRYLGIQDCDVPRRLFTALFASTSQIIHVLMSADSIQEIWQNLENTFKHNMIERYPKRRDARRNRMY